MNYGFPYMGSKTKLAEKILNHIPSAENFYDLFAGGCAITHRALLEDFMGVPKFKNIFSNDIQGTTLLFKEATEGKYKNERRWISREDFNKEKDTNPYVRWVWSFGNNGSAYLFGKDVEPIKKLAHEYLMANGYDGTSETRIKLLKEYKEKLKIDGRFELQQLQQLQQLERLQQLQQLERLERLQQLQQLERLERLSVVTTTSSDYRDIDILPNSVIYCDPPYKDTAGYSVNFNHEEFWEWVRTNKYPVYVSEYKAPEDIKCVAEFEHRTSYSSSKKGRKKTIEKLFWNCV